MSCSVYMKPNAGLAAGIRQPAHTGEVVMAITDGYCFKVCSECVIYQATQSDDDHRRVAIAKTLSEIYDKKLKPEDINCDGCRSDGNRLFRKCLDCSIRNREISTHKKPA